MPSTLFNSLTPPSLPPSLPSSHLLGHEGPGSILASLKTKGWATAIVAGISGEGYDSSTGLALFTLTVTLTEGGVKKWSEIISLIYTYLGLIRREGWQKWIWEELAAISAMQYKYQEEIESGDLAEQLCVGLLPMYGFRKEEVLQAPFLMWEWRPEWMEGMMTIISDPNKCRIDLMSSVFGRAGVLDALEQKEGQARREGGREHVIEGVSVEKEPRFGVHFTREKLPEATLQGWADNFAVAVAVAAAAVEPGEKMEVEGKEQQQQEPRLALPLPNPFIATDLAVKDLPPRRDPLSSSSSSSSSSSVVPPSLLPSASSLSLLSSNSSNNNDNNELESSLQRLQTDCPEVTPILSQIQSSLPPSYQYHYPTLLPPSFPPSFDALHLWHLQDRVFRTPRAAIYLKLATPHAYASPRHEAMTELFIRLIQDSLNETTYLASVAELHYALKGT